MSEIANGTEFYFSDIPLVRWNDRYAKPSIIRIMQSLGSDISKMSDGVWMVEAIYSQSQHSSSVPLQYPPLMVLKMYNNEERDDEDKRELGTIYERILPFFEKKGG